MDNISASTVGDIDMGEAGESAAVYRQYRFVPRPLKLAQDAHSPGEQLLYAKMWELAPAAMGESRFRLLTCGYTELARELRCDKKQVRRWLEELISKLAVDVAAAPGYRSKTTYRVYSWQAAIDRRKKSGYVAYIKNRGGVTLLKSTVPTVDTESLPPVGDETVSTVGSKSPVTVGSVSTVGVDTDEAGGVDTESRIKKQAPYKASPSEQEVRELTAGLRTLTDDVDDGFVRALFDRCRQKQPDCTVAEILHFTIVKARYGKVNRSFTGFLLAAVPGCFSGESFRQYREDALRKREAEREQRLAEKAGAEEVLSSRDTREAWEIDFAESTLRLLQDQEPGLFAAAEGEGRSREEPADAELQRGYEDFLRAQIEAEIGRRYPGPPALVASQILRNTESYYLIAQMPAEDRQRLAEERLRKAVKQELTLPSFEEWRKTERSHRR